MYSAEYFHSSASPAQSHFPSRYFAPRAGTSVWRQRGAWLCRLEQVEEHIVDQLMMRVSALSLGGDASCCCSRARSTLTPRETDFQTYAVCF